MTRKASDPTPNVQLVATTAPLNGPANPSVNNAAISDVELDDDGMSSSDDDDHDSYLRDSPLPMEDNPLDLAGATLPAPTAVDERRRSSSSTSLSALASGPVPPTSTSNKRRIFRRRKGKRQFKYDQDNGVLGIVVMEIQSASDLPKLKNG